MHALAIASTISNFASVCLTVILYDLVQLEVFKKTLLQSLHEDDGSDVSHSHQHSSCL